MECTKCIELTEQLNNLIEENQLLKLKLQTAIEQKEVYMKVIKSSIGKLQEITKPY